MAVRVHDFQHARFRAAHGFQDDCTAGEWERIFPGGGGVDGDANVCAFDRSGAFLAVGTTRGKVLVWDLCGVRRCVRELSVDASYEAAANDGLLPVQAIRAATPGPVASQPSSSADGGDATPVASPVSTPANTPVDADAATASPAVITSEDAGTARAAESVVSGGDVVDAVSVPPMAASPSASPTSTHTHTTHTHAHTRGSPAAMPFGRMRDYAAVTALCWTASSRYLVWATKCGLLFVGDLTTERVCVCVKAPTTVRLLHAHPRHDHLLLVTPVTGMPALVNWVQARAWQFPEAVLPPPSTRRGRASTGAKHAVLRTDACFDERDGAHVYVVSTRGDVLALRTSLVERCEELVPDDTPVHVFRVAEGVASQPIVPPEIHHSRFDNVIMVTTRNGVVVYDPRTLQPVERGYNEPVDNTLLVTARMLQRDSCIVTLPHANSGHMSGGMYVFRRGAVGDLKLKPGPAGGVAMVDAHPTLGLVAGISTRGIAYILQQPFAAEWRGPMFPVGFRMVMENKEYDEPEDEYDLVDEDGNIRMLQGTTPPPEPEEIDVLPHKEELPANVPVYPSLHDLASTQSSGADVAAGTRFEMLLFGSSSGFDFRYTQTPPAGQYLLQYYERVEPPAAIHTRLRELARDNERKLLEMGPAAFRRWATDILQQEGAVVMVSTPVIEPVTADDVPALIARLRSLPTTSGGHEQRAAPTLHVNLAPEKKGDVIDAEYAAIRQAKLWELAQLTQQLTVAERTAMDEATLERIASNIAAHLSGPLARAQAIADELKQRTASTSKAAPKTSGGGITTRAQAASAAPAAATSAVVAESTPKSRRSAAADSPRPDSLVDTGSEKAPAPADTTDFIAASATGEPVQHDADQAVGIRHDDGLADEGTHAVTTEQVVGDTDLLEGGAAATKRPRLG